jgi:hypothetical protein
LPAEPEQRQRQVHFRRVERPAFQNLKADADAAAIVDHAIVEPVHDHGAVIGCRQHEGDLALGVSHSASSP